MFHTNADGGHSPPSVKSIYPHETLRTHQAPSLRFSPVMNYLVDCKACPTHLPKQKPPQRCLAPLWWPGPRRKPSQHSTFFGKIAIFIECCDGFYCFAARSKCQRPNSSNVAGIAVTTMPAPTSVCCTPNVAASHGAIASGATPANILPKPMTELTRPSCSSGAVVCTIVLWSGLTMPQAMPSAI